MSVEKRVSQAVDHPTSYSITADHEHRDLAIGVAETYLDSIADSIANHPRSLQKRIGPSELGKPCKRDVLHKLNGDEEPPRPNVPWKPTVGTAVHSYMDGLFSTAANPGGREEGRWLTEETVSVGYVGGTEITGSCDLYDTWSGTVLDHKIIGSWAMKNYRANGPSEQYRRQAHLYGKGFEDDGFPVRLVAIAFLPRDGELTDAYIWTAPYQRSIAEDTLQTVNHLETLRAALGIEAALALYPECEDRWCPWCGTQSTFTPRKPTNDLQLIP